MRSDLTASAARALWDRMRTTGVPDNSQCREAVALRGVLLSLGRWRDVYRDPDSLCTSETKGKEDDHEADEGADQEDGHLQADFPSALFPEGGRDSLFAARGLEVLDA